LAISLKVPYRDAGHATALASVCDRRSRMSGTMPWPATVIDRRYKVRYKDRCKDEL
jgi:hypothetical protein